MKMKNEKRTLVIHPEDRSTTFLKPIYKTASNKIVKEKDATSNEILNLIKTSERTMMMGHGCPSGLFSIGLIRDKGIVVRNNECDALRAKDQNIYIWCHADKFVEANDLKGFYSGMFISEVGEAFCCGVKANREQVDESNNTFSEIVGKYIDLPVN